MSCIPCVATTGTTVVAPDVHSQPTPTIVIEETPLDSATQPVATECAVPQRSTQFALGMYVHMEICECFDSCLMLEVKRLLHVRG